MRFYSVKVQVPYHFDCDCYYYITANDGRSIQDIKDWINNCTFDGKKFSDSCKIESVTEIIEESIINSRVHEEDHIYDKG